MASVRGLEESGYASSSAVKAASRTAAGQRPARSGKSSGGDQCAPVRSAIHATASAAARQGFSTDQTFPSRITSGTKPSQKTTQTKVGARFVATEFSPNAAAAKTRARSAKESAPQTMRTSGP